MTIAGYVPYFTIYSNAGAISLASEGIIAIPVPVIPPIEPPVSGGGGAGGGATSRGRMIRKRRKREDEPVEVIGNTPVETPALTPLPPPSPPQPMPGLMAGIPIPPITVLRSPPVENEDEIEIALLLELLS